MTSRLRPRLLAPLALTVIGGCYLSHPGDAVSGRDTGVIPRVDAGRRDARMPPVPDADIPPPLDGFVPPLDATMPPFDGGPFFDSGPLFDGGPFFDAGPPRDAGRRDAGPPRDAGRRDAGPPRDAGRRDAGPPPFDAGPPRPALRMSPTTYFEVDDSPAFDSTFAWTLELWVRPRAVNTIRICGKGDAMASHFVIGQLDGQVYGGWQVGTEERFVYGPVLPVGEWTHVAVAIGREPGFMTYSARLFVNGTRVAVTNGLTGVVESFNDVPFSCGRGDVDVDEIRLWRVARSEAAIAAAMNNRISGSIPGFLAYWRLDEAGQIALDYTASGHVGVLGRLTTTDSADPTWILDGAI